MKSSFRFKNADLRCKDCEMFTDELIDGSCPECYDKRPTVLVEYVNADNQNTKTEPYPPGMEPIENIEPGGQVYAATDQDKGKPSPVPFTLLMQRPSPDIDAAGVPTIYVRGSYRELWELLSDVRKQFNVSDDFIRFLSWAFESGGYYRFELIVGDWSIKVYKHPNNP